MVETIGIIWILVSALGAVVLLATASQAPATGFAFVAVVGVVVLSVGRLTRGRL